MNLQSATNLQWANAEHTRIDMVIRWDTINEDLPFTADPNDSAEHGRAIYAAAVAGQFGPIAEYVPPANVFDPAAPAPSPTSITPLEFIDRFTEAEQLAIVTATMSNVAVKLWYDKLLAAQTVVFADPRLSTGLDGLVAAGLITAERKAEILPESGTAGVTVL